MTLLQSMVFLRDFLDTAFPTEITKTTFLQHSLLIHQTLRYITTLIL